MSEGTQMGLEKVIGRIEADGKAEAEKLLAGAKREAYAALTEAKAKREAILAGYTKRAEDDVRLLKARESARTEVGSKKALLAGRKAALDEAFEFVLSAARALPAQERARIHSRLASRLGPEFAGGVIRCRKGDEGHFAGAKGMRVRADLDAAGGFVAESGDGLMAADMRFETLLAAIWEKRMAETSAALFGKG
jgi:vacuolar-type H+-ATPase subunit E/Vma4